MIRLGAHTGWKPHYDRNSFYHRSHGSIIGKVVNWLVFNRWMVWEYHKDFICPPFIWNASQFWGFQFCRVLWPWSSDEPRLSRKRSECVWNYILKGNCMVTYRVKWVKILTLFSFFSNVSGTRTGHIVWILEGDDIVTRFLFSRFFPPSTSSCPEISFQSNMSALQSVVLLSHLWSHRTWVIKCLGMFRGD